jgi:peptidoglycan/LPS O-acetylase OafA/YrhL
MVPQLFGTRMVDGVYWTLIVTIKFYALVWGLVVLRQTRHLEGWLVAWILLALAASLSDLGGVARSISIMPYGIFFAAGGVFFFVRDSGWNLQRVAMLVLCLGLASYHAAAGIERFIDAAHVTSAAQGTTIAIVASMFTAFALLANRDMRTRHAGVLAALAVLTYPIYLLDDVGKEIFIFGLSGTPVAVKVSLAIAFTVALAWLVNQASKRLIQPALQRGLDLVRLR